MSDALAPFDAGLVITRLRAAVPALREVAGCAESFAAFKAPGALPAAYVMLTEEAIDSRRLTEQKEHGATAIVDVLIAVRNYTVQELGRSHVADVRVIAGAVRAALNGWRPTLPTGVRSETMRGFGRAQVVHYDNAVLWWRERFSIEYRSRIA